MVLSIMSLYMIVVGTVGLMVGVVGIGLMVGRLKWRNRKTSYEWFRHKYFNQGACQLRYVMSYPKGWLDCGRNYTQRLDFWYSYPITEQEFEERVAESEWIASRSALIERLYHPFRWNDLSCSQRFWATWYWPLISKWTPTDQCQDLYDNQVIDQAILKLGL